MHNWSQCTPVTDRQTDGRMDDIMAIAGRIVLTNTSRAKHNARMEERVTCYCTLLYVMTSKVSVISSGLDRGTTIGCELGTASAVIAELKSLATNCESYNRHAHIIITFTWTCNVKTRTTSLTDRKRGVDSRQMADQYRSVYGSKHAAMLARY